MQSGSSRKQVHYVTYGALMCGRGKRIPLQDPVHHRQGRGLRERAWKSHLCQIHSALLRSLQSACEFDDTPKYS